MDGSFETAYVSPTIKTEDRWGREDVMGGRQGLNDSYRGRRSPGKTSDMENMNHLPSDSRVLFNHRSHFSQAVPFLKKRRCFTRRCFPLFLQNRQALTQ